LPPSPNNPAPTWVKLEYNKPYYDTHPSDYDSYSILTEDAVIAADPQINYTNFDGNGHEPHFITVIHSGHGDFYDYEGSHYGGGVYDGWLNWTTDDGVEFGDDAMVGAGLFGDGGKQVPRIGAFCYAFIDVAMDIYDIKQVGTYHSKWGIMTGGGRGFDGTFERPSHLSAYNKISAGWFDSVTITTDQWGNYDLPDWEEFYNDSDDSHNYNPIYRIDLPYKDLVVNDREMMGYSDTELLGTFNNKLLGLPGAVAINDVRYVGHDASVGKFKGGMVTGLGIESGVVISTGRVLHKEGTGAGAHWPDIPFNSFLIDGPYDASSVMGTPGDLEMSWVVYTPDFSYFGPTYDMDPNSKGDDPSDPNGIINLPDFAVFTNHWLGWDCQYPDACGGADFNLSGEVDMIDLNALASHWLESVPVPEPPDPDDPPEEEPTYEEIYNEVYDAVFNGEIALPPTWEVAGFEIDFNIIPPPGGPGEAQFNFNFVLASDEYFDLEMKLDAFTAFVTYTRPGETDMVIFREFKLTPAVDRILMPELIANYDAYGWFIDNELHVGPQGMPYYNLQYDGFMIPMTAESPVFDELFDGNGDLIDYTLKILVADTGFPDPSLRHRKVDTAVFLQADSFTVNSEPRPFGYTEEVEYLLIENRQPVGFETEMPGDGGLAIWHVDPEIYFAGGAPGYPGQPLWPYTGTHYGLAMLQADGSYDLENFIPSDAGDLFAPGDFYNRCSINNELTRDLDGDEDPNSPDRLIHAFGDTYQWGLVFNTHQSILDIHSKEKRADRTDLPEGAVLNFTLRDRAIKNDDWTRPVALEEEGQWDPENETWNYAGTTGCGLVTHTAYDVVLNYGYSDPDINGFVKFLDVADDQHDQDGVGWFVAPEEYLGDLNPYRTLSWSQKIFRQGDSPTIQKGWVEISGPGGSAFFETDEFISEDWQTFTVILLPEYWVITSGDWTGLCADVTELKIRVEAVINPDDQVRSPGSLLDICAIDEIILTPFDGDPVVSSFTDVHKSSWRVLHLIQGPQENAASNLNYFVSLKAGRAYTAMDNETFNAMSVETLVADYDVIVVPWYVDEDANLDWATRLLPYMQGGGGILWEDPYNLDDLDGSGMMLSGDTSGYTEEGMTLVSPFNKNGAESYYHVHYAIDSATPNWSVWSTDANGSIHGLYGEFGDNGGRMVIGVSDNLYHPEMVDSPEVDHLNLLKNQMNWLSSGDVNIGPTTDLDGWEGAGSGEFYFARAHGNTFLFDDPKRGELWATCVGYDFIRNEGPIDYREPKDPADVWFTFTPEVDDVYSVFIRNNVFDTVLAVYWGPDEIMHFGMGPLACDDDESQLAGDAFYQAEEHFYMFAGHTYYIRVSGYYEYGEYEMGVGKYKLPNEDCEGAIALVNWEMVEADLTDAAPTIGLGDDRDLWYSYSPTKTDYVTIILHSDEFDPNMSIYPESSLQDPNYKCSVLADDPLVMNNDCGTTIVYESHGPDSAEVLIDTDAICGAYGHPTDSRITMMMEEGKEYLIRVSGVDNTDGVYTIVAYETPVNDRPENAIPMFDYGESADPESAIFYGFTVGATPSFDGETRVILTCDDDELNDDLDVWHSYKPKVSESVIISLCDTEIVDKDFDTTLAIYNQAGDNLLACNNDVCSVQSELTMNMTAGETYLIRVAGRNGMASSYGLRVTGGRGDGIVPPVIHPPFAYTWEVGQPVDLQVQVTDGMPPYVNWNVAPLDVDLKYVELPREEPNRINEVPQDWYGDETAWDYAMPFDFPFYDESKTVWAGTTISISANGFIVLDGQSVPNSNFDSIDKLRQYKMIAPLWDDFQPLSPTTPFIFTEEGEDAGVEWLLVRWEGQSYVFGEGNLCNFSVKLYENGVIEFDYAAGTVTVPTVGISDGDGESLIIEELTREALPDGSFDNAIVTTNTVFRLMPPFESVPVLPDGLTFSEGVVSGTPTTAGVWQVRISLDDSYDPVQSASEDFIFTIE